MKLAPHQFTGSSGESCNLLQGSSLSSCISRFGSLNQYRTDLVEVTNDRDVSGVALVVSTQTTRSMQPLSRFVCSEPWVQMDMRKNGSFTALTNCARALHLWSFLVVFTRFGIQPTVVCDKRTPRS